MCYVMYKNLIVIVFWSVTSPLLLGEVIQSNCLMPHKLHAKLSSLSYLFSSQNEAFHKVHLGRLRETFRFT